VLCSFLGYVDLQGTTYQAPTLATGFASHFAQPLLREAYERRQEEGRSGAKQGELLSREEAEAVLDTCMKVLFYRDARSLNKVGQRGLDRTSVYMQSWLTWLSQWPRSTKSLPSLITGSTSRPARKTRPSGSLQRVCEGMVLRSSRTGSVGHECSVEAEFVFVYDIWFDDGRICRR
jgi:hypothetical protein